jgi:hypothetical protein
MARYSWKLETTQVAEAADAAIAELHAEVAEWRNAAELETRVVVHLKAELAEVRNPEPIHEEFVFSCPTCGQEGMVSIDVLPREEP